MNTIITVSFLLFLFYYLASFNSLKIDHKWIFILCFLFSAFALRIIIDPSSNKDYYGYFQVFNFNNPDNVVSFLLSEPYIYIIYNFFELFTSDKKYIFLGIYWFNFLITNVFFIWLVTRKDIAIWKKILLFVFYYFLFAFVLLRNGPVYIMFAYFFYSSYRNKKFLKILFTPFMHLSALVLLVVMFHKYKHYLKIFFAVIVLLIPIFILYLIPILIEVTYLQGSVSKIDTYTKIDQSVALFHKIHFFFVTAVVLITIWVYKKQVLNPILITAMLFYYIAFYVSPVMGFRFSPYVFLAILLFNFNGKYNSQVVRNLNLASFFLFPYFLFTLLDTHYL